MSGVVILGYARTPFGRFFGALRDLPAHQLGALAVDELLRRTGAAPAKVAALYAGVGMASGGVFTPAREIVLASGLPDTTPSLAVDRACCSGMTALGLAFRDLLAGQTGLVIAGGCESLSRTPLWAARARRTRPGDPAAVDAAAPVYDPLLLKSPVEGKAIADYTGEEALAHGVTREHAGRVGGAEPCPVLRGGAGGCLRRRALRGRRTCRPTRARAATPPSAKLAALPTIYASPTITAGNAPGLSDGAAFLLLGTPAMADKLGPAGAGAPGGLRAGGRRSHVGVLDAGARHPAAA